MITAKLLRAFAAMVPSKKNNVDAIEAPMREDTE